MCCRTSLRVLRKLLDSPASFCHNSAMAASFSTAGTALPAKTRYCGYHHRPTALCEYLATTAPCHGTGEVVVLGEDGPEVSACTCSFCTDTAEVA